MMRRLLSMFSAGFVMLCIALPAHAEDSLESVTNGLKSSPVYISPGVSGIPASTAADLQDMMYKDDHIVLVMLPESAHNSIGDPSSFAVILSKSIGADKIIGLAVGSQTVGFSSYEPAIASDMMHRAESVSTNDVVTLGTFVRNIHEWQSENPDAMKAWEHAPDPKPKPSAKSPSEDGSSWFWWALVAVFAVLMAVLGYIRQRRRRDGPPDESRKRFEAPDEVSDLLTEIARKRDKVQDAELRQTLFQCCSDIERYFQKYSSDKERDATKFNNNLKSVLSVLSKYLEVQDSERDFNNPEETMRVAKKSINDFADYVIRSIRRGNDSRLMDYQVDTDILQAQRYR